MFPMVSEPWEFDAANAIVEEQADFLRTRRRHMPESIEYGCMLEVPSLAEVLDLLLPKVSFISVGTNDLTQFLFAADRANPKLAERYDWLSPAILRFMDRIAKNMVGSKVRLAVCGEMGGRRLEALALMGLGFTRFSITPAAVGPIKELVRKVYLPDLSAQMQRWLLNPPADMRAELTQWAADNDIDLD